MILSPTRLPTQPAYGQRKELFLEVIVQDNESLEGALKRFRRQCQRSGLMAEVRRRSHYVKPSEQRRLAVEKAKRKEAKRAARRR